MNYIGQQAELAQTGYVAGGPVKSKKTLKSWLRSWLNSSSDNKDEYIHMPKPMVSVCSPDIDSRDGLNITIHSANGGYVLSFRRYDMRTDRHDNKLYVITSDQKFEEALAHCIAMECLSR